MKYYPVLRIVFCISVIWWSFYEILNKAVNIKLVVLINYRKINRQQKNTFIMCKQLNGPVLKSFKAKRSEPKSETKLCLGKDYLFSFEPDRDCCHVGQVGPGKIRPTWTSNTEENFQQWMFEKSFFVWKGSVAPYVSDIFRFTWEIL